jgi:hypothetical protein
MAGPTRVVGRIKRFGQAARDLMGSSSHGTGMADWTVETPDHWAAGHQNGCRAERLKWKNSSVSIEALSVRGLFLLRRDQITQRFCPVQSGFCWSLLLHGKNENNAPTQPVVGGDRDSCVCHPL